MTRDEAVKKLSTVGRLSMSYAEDLYDSFFEKPVVPQCVADWYEEHKDNLNEEIWEYLVNWDDGQWNDFKKWMFPCNDNNALITLVNMHQFGYEVEKEKRYKVKIKANKKDPDYLVNTATNGLRFYNGIYLQNRAHTRKELEDADFGWVFDCEGIEIEEVE